MTTEANTRNVSVPSIAESSLKASWSARDLATQNRAYRGTGGVSAGNSSHGFMPAFMDQTTGTAYLSRFADGRVAPMHVLGGLPEALVTDRDPNGRIVAVKDCIVAGFLLRGSFYTREQAARAVSHRNTWRAGPGEITTRTFS
ncbi:MAG: hypothetical protein U9R74_15960 [Pseudomonadota bacterium]|nr:hypothetical protein [Pseudomonadota bacterium]